MKRISLGKPKPEQAIRLNGKPQHIKLSEYGQSQHKLPFYGYCLECMGNICGCMRMFMPCICCCFVDYPLKIVPQGYVGIYEKYGRYVKTVEAGLYFINPCSEEMQMITVKINVLDLNRQNLITKDNVSINIDASVYYRIIKPQFAYYRVQQVNTAISQIVYGILKNTCGSFTLQDLLQKRNKIAQDLEKQIDKYVYDWGIDIQQIFIKDLKLDQDLQQSLSVAVKQRRISEAKLIEAKTAVTAAKLMRLAANELSAPAAMQIRYLETIQKMGNHSSKVLFMPKIKNNTKLQHYITLGMVHDRNQLISQQTKVQYVSPPQQISENQQYGQEEKYQKEELMYMGSEEGEWD